MTELQVSMEFLITNSHFQKSLQQGVHDSLAGVQTSWAGHFYQNVRTFFSHFGQLAVGDRRERDDYSISVSQERIQWLPFKQIKVSEIITKVHLNLFILYLIPSQVVSKVTNVFSLFFPWQIVHDSSYLTFSCNF